MEVTAIVGHTRLGTLSKYQVQFSLYGPHGSDISYDLMTLTFNLGGHGGGADAGLRPSSAHQL